MTVPVPMETVGPVDQPARAVRFNCLACGRKFSTKSDLAGKKIRCNGCGAGVRVPLGDVDSVTPYSRTAMNTYAGKHHQTTPPRSAGDHAMYVDVSSDDDDEASDSSPRLDELALASIKRSRRRGRTESVLPSRSQTMEQVRQQVAEDEAVETRKKAEKTRKKKKKKKKRSSDFDPKETLTLVAGVGALVAVLAVVAWAYPDVQFPLGGLLCVIGFIVYILGAISLRQLVAEEGILKVLLFRFCPPYQLWFVATRWAETKDFVAFFGTGLVIMSIGGAVIKTSPTGKKAEASDQAYQKMLRGGQPAAPPAVPKGIARDDD